MRKDSKAYNFLVVEDNLSDFVLIEEYLSEYILDAGIAHAASFEAAKQKLTSNKSFDLIFLDLSLPDHAGEDLIKDTLQLSEGIPIVVLTGFSDLDFSIRSLALGVSDYLLKDELNSAFLYKSLIYAIERNRYIEELQDSQRRYSELFHLNPSPMWVFEQKTLQFLDVNDAAVKKYGFSEAEFLQMKLSDIICKNISRTNVDKSIDSPLKHEIYMNRETHYTKSNQKIDVQIEAAPIEYNGVEAKIVVVNDITDQIRHIVTIEEQNKTFREIAWIQSHVVRAPLSRLMGLINLLDLKDNETSEENLELINYIKNSAEELDQIIRDISKKSESILSDKSDN
ncbi:MAG: two component signal transduction system response regulator with PAS sensory domain [Algoriphagus marincola HL-49]|uniref:histidine kinase n=1 Tax=Algoriphagus marincola HL-49 TaxID=1305737 RepID=A0A0P7Y7P3_9BACT|nr:MAG: two component signal transduction system response regulator with PAS sensory domain [Algoriphagus marincola HL-49]